MTALSGESFLPFSYPALLIRPYGGTQQRDFAG